MTDLPPGFVLEKDAPKVPKAIDPPPGFEVEGQGSPDEQDEPGFGMNPKLKQGLTMTFADEIAGAAKALGPEGLPHLLSGDFGKFGEAYSRGRKEELGRVAQFEKEHPVGGLASEIGGGLVSGGALRPSTAAVTKMGEMFSRMPAWLQSTGLGALWGSLYGAGSADEGLAERLKGAGIGGAAGAATGGVVHGVTRGIQAGSEGVRGYLRARKDPERQAARVVGRAFRSDEIPLGRGQARLKELGPQAMIADVGGENVLGVARGAAGAPGPAKHRVVQALRSRSEGESGRIASQVEKNLGPGDFFATEDALLQKLSKGAREVYTPAYAKHPMVDSPKLRRMLGDPTVKQAIKEASFIAGKERLAGQSRWLGPVDDELTAAARSAADVGKMDKLGRPGVAKGLSLETWDYVKRGIDSLLDNKRFRNELTGKLNKKGYAVNQLRKSLVKELDRATGGEKSLYAAARKQYGDTAEIIEALREGAKFFRQAPEQIQSRLGDLSEAGQVAYRNGAARAVMDVIEGTVDKASAANRLFNKSINRAKIRAAFPEGKYTDFARRMVAEQRFADTKNFIGSGSRTAPMAEEIADITRKFGNIGAVLGSEMPGGGHALVKSGIGRRMLQGLLGSPTEMNKALARMLTTKNRAEQLRLFELMAPHIAQRPDIHPMVRGMILGATQQEAGALESAPGR